MSISFKTTVYFNGYRLSSYNDMASFLIENYVSAVNLVKDNTLFDLIKEGDETLYEEIVESTKEFEYCENIITYIIYRLSSEPIFVTKNHRFTSTYEIALAMHRSYPDLNNDALILLKEKVLSKIYWEEYIFTSDARHKRNHDFLLNVEENSKYLFSYYYFLILHLPSNEETRFIVNNIKFNSLDELISYLYTNQKHIHQLITEIKSNYYVLGLLASKSSINQVAKTLSSDNYLDFLLLLNTVNSDGTQSYDFTAILSSKMSVWMLNNYQNYSYKTLEAKKLLREYSLVVRKPDMSFLELFTQVKYLDELYDTFLSLYKSDRIIEDISEIVSNSEDYHLGYFHNDEVVCSRYLTDYDLIKEDINTPDYIISQEKSLVINRLNRAQAKLEKHNDLLHDYYSKFTKERYNLLSFKFCIFASLIISLICGFLFVFLEEIVYLSEHEQFFVRILGGIGLLLSLIVIVFTTIEQNKLSLINDKQKQYNRYTNKINKMKIKVTNLTYYKESITTSGYVIDEEIDNSIVKKRLKINFLKRYTKFYDKAIKLSQKQCDVKEYNFNILSYITLSIAYLPALIFINHIIFNIINVELTYPLVSEFGVFYLIFALINVVLISNKNAYRNTFIFYLISIIATLIINIL